MKSPICLICGIFTAAILGLASCEARPGALFTPTLAPNPSITQTSIPSSTPDPMVLALDDAKESWNAGDAEGAIFRYRSVLHQSSDASIRAQAFVGLLDIASENKRQADMRWKIPDNASHIQGCPMYKLALAAYQPILDAQDRPTFEENPFYTDVAGVKVGVAGCALDYQESKISYSEAISSLLDALTILPDKPEIKDVLVPAIQNMYQNDLWMTYKENPSEATNLGQSIIAKIGDYQAKGEKVSDWVTERILNVGPCVGNPVLSTTVGSSKTKKIFSCASSITPAVEGAGLLAGDLSEIWFVSNYEEVETDPVNCTGFDTDLHKNFTYSYNGRWREIYSLTDVHSGKIVSSKTFSSTAPRCVFTSCSLNTLSLTATCTGGEASSTYDEAALVQWLKGQVR